MLARMHQDVDRSSEAKIWLRGQAAPTFDAYLEVERQLFRAGLVAIISFVAFICVLLFMQFGPRLAGQEAVFAAFVLISCAVVFCIALYALLGPFLSHLAAERFRSTQKDLELMETTEETELVLGQVSSVVADLELCMRQDSLSDVRRSLKVQIDRLRKLASAEDEKHQAGQVG